MSATVSMPLGGVQVGSYPSRERAQAAVDYLAHKKFPMNRVSIVGSDLRVVERVTGRLTWGRAIGLGAAAGAWWGLFVALLLGLCRRLMYDARIRTFGFDRFRGDVLPLYFATTRSAWIGLLLLGLVLGGVFGAAFAALGYRAMRRHRDFTGTSGIVPTHYDVLCDPVHADDARVLLSRFSLRD